MRSGRLAPVLHRSTENGREDFVDHLARRRACQEFGQAFAKVVFENRFPGVGERTLDGGQLMQHSEAIVLVFRHADHGVKMATSSPKSSNCILVESHYSLPNQPYPQHELVLCQTFCGAVVHSHQETWARARQVQSRYGDRR